MSGRNVEYAIHQNTKANVRDADIHYLDKDGFSANFRNNSWFFQKFHTKEQINAIVSRIGGGNIKYIGGGFYIQAKNAGIEKDEAIKALRYEFNMILPNGQRYALADAIEAAYIQCIDNFKTQL